MTLRSQGLDVLLALDDDHPGALGDGPDDLGQPVEHPAHPVEVPGPAVLVAMALAEGLAPVGQRDAQDLEQLASVLVGVRVDV